MAELPDIEVKLRISEVEIQRLGVRDGDVLVVRLSDDDAEFTDDDAPRRRAEAMDDAGRALAAALDKAGLAKVGVLVTRGDVQFSVVRGES